ncbi:MAG: DNA recombination protein RmuC, partial [Fusobacteriaceae bacterium]
IVKNAEREKYAHIIQEELVKLSSEFGRYKTRWEKLSSDIDKVSKDVKDINTTSEKISKRFQSIANVDDDIKIIES